MALDYFFNQSGSMWHLVYHPCDWDTHMNADWCKPYLARPPMSSSIKSWMRNHDCVSSFDEWHTSNLNQPEWTYTDWVGYETTLSMNWNQLATTASTIGCCDACAIAGGNVDVYYWPVSGSNHDCTSSIGTSDIDPDLGLFTTDARGHKNFVSQPNPYATDASDDLTSTTVYSTTAQYLLIYSIIRQFLLINPMLFRPIDLPLLRVYRDPLR